MDFGSVSLLQMLKSKMSYLGARQTQLSENIANADTPGYAPKDVVAPTFQKLVMAANDPLPMFASDPRHITSRPGNIGAYRPDKMRVTYEVTPMRNGVVLEEQMMMMSETQFDYTKVTNIYNKMTGLFKTAIGNS